MLSAVCAVYFPSAASVPVTVSDLALLSGISAAADSAPGTDPGISTSEPGLNRQAAVKMMMPDRVIYEVKKRRLPSKMIENKRFFAAFTIQLKK